VDVAVNLKSYITHMEYQPQRNQKSKLIQGMAILLNKGGKLYEEIDKEHKESSGSFSVVVDKLKRETNSTP